MLQGNYPKCLGIWHLLDKVQTTQWSCLIYSMLSQTTDILSYHSPVSCHTSRDIISIIPLRAMSFRVQILYSCEYRFGVLLYVSVTVLITCPSRRRTVSNNVCNIVTLTPHNYVSQSPYIYILYCTSYQTVYIKFIWLVFSFSLQKYHSSTNLWISVQSYLQL